MAVYARPEPHRDDTPHIKTAIRLSQVVQAAKEQAGSGKQHQGHRHLSYDQRLAHPPADSMRRRPACCPQAPRSKERWAESEKDRSSQCQGDRKREDVWIERKLVD